MQLLGHRAVALRRLTLETAERGEIALALQHGLDAVGTERPDQLVLEVVDAREEADGLQAVAIEAGAGAGPLQHPSDDRSLGDVVEPGQADAPGEDRRGERPDGRRPAGRDDGDTLGGEVAAPAVGEDLERHAVAQPLDEDDRAGAGRHVVGGGDAGRPRPGCHVHGAQPASRRRPSLSRRRGSPGSGAACRSASCRSGRRSPRPRAASAARPWRCAGSASAASSTAGSRPGSSRGSTTRRG